MVGRWTVWAGSFVPNGQVKSTVAALDKGSRETWMTGCNWSLQGSREGTQALRTPRRLWLKSSNNPHLQLSVSTGDWSFGNSGAQQRFWGLGALSVWTPYPKELSKPLTFGGLSELWAARERPCLRSQSHQQKGNWISRFFRGWKRNCFENLFWLLQTLPFPLAP